MSNLILKPIFNDEDKTVLKSEIQEAFQMSYEAEFGKWDKPIIRNEDIEESFNAEGAELYFAEIDGIRVGGTVIVINDKTGCNSIELLYVKPSAQNSGNGYKIWKAIEELHPETLALELYTPYFDKRNIHFYVNRLGFQIVEFFNPKHKDPHQTGDTAGNIPEENNYFFKFKKEMQ